MRDHIPEPTTPDIAEAHAHRVVAIEELQQALMTLLTFDADVPGADRAAVELRGWNALRNVQREGLPGMVPCAEGAAP